MSLKQSKLYNEDDRSLLSRIPIPLPIPTAQKEERGLINHSVSTAQPLYHETQLILKLLIQKELRFSSPITDPKPPMKPHEMPPLVLPQNSSKKSETVVTAQLAKGSRLLMPTMYQEAIQSDPRVITSIVFSLLATTINQLISSFARPPSSENDLFDVSQDKIGARAPALKEKIDYKIDLKKEFFSTRPSETPILPTKIKETAPETFTSKIVEEKSLQMRQPSPLTRAITESTIITQILQNRPISFVSEHLSSPVQTNAVVSQSEPQAVIAFPTISLTLSSYLKRKKREEIIRERKPEDDPEDDCPLMK